MKKRLFFIGLITLLSIGLFIFLVKSGDPVVLQPAGTIAAEQKSILLFATVLSLIVILPVFALTFFIVWRYRASNTKATYKPNWDHNVGLEVLWWGIPIIIILILAVLTWRTSHDLDPYKALESDTKPLTVQVVALEWRWLFIYPEQNIATLNYVQIPEKTPVEFKITADAPMNSFWIPQLGGQIYAMAGMQTELNLMADSVGTYTGSSANLSGEGFAGMTFIAESSTRSDFDAWVRSVRQSGQHLDGAHYATLAEQSTDKTMQYFASRDPELFSGIIARYMGPEHETETHEEETNHAR